MEMTNEFKTKGLASAAYMTSYEYKEFDASIATGLWLLTCPIIHYGFCPYSTKIILEAEEAVKVDVTICGTNTSRRPYGELGSVDKGNCCCFVIGKSNLGEIFPGWGCENDKVEQIVIELKKRMKGRGDTAQIRRTEDILQKFAVLEEKFEKLEGIDAKLDAIMKHLDISEKEVIPPSSLEMGSRIT